ncbi:MAG: hypothetical protein GXC73_17825 [Chitinophagaceae bacterium]|nr:hypothetical protein [Chitinophagaceae bacterium]
MKSTLLILFFFAYSIANAQTDSSTVSIHQPVNTDSVYEKPDVEAQFPGGEQKWNKFIQTAIERNIDDLVDDKKSRGTCILKFIVDTNGIVSALRITTLNGTVLGKTSSAAILNGPNWIPATINGVKVKSVRIQKVTFRVTRG